MSVADFFAYLIDHDASWALGVALAETYAEREHGAGLPAARPQSRRRTA